MIPLLGRRFCIVSPSFYTLLATINLHSVPPENHVISSPPPTPKSSDPHQEINNDRSLWARYERLWSLTDDAEEAKTTSNQLNWNKNQFSLQKIFRKKTVKWLLTPACLRWSSKRGRSGRGEVKSHLSPSSPRIPVPRTLKRRLCTGGLWTLFRVWLTLYWYFKLNKFEIYSPGFSSAAGLAFASSISLMHSALSSSDSHKFLFSSLWNRKRRKRVGLSFF